MFPVPAKRVWPLTLFLRKDRRVISNRFQLMHVDFWAVWIKHQWIRLTDFLRQLPSIKKQLVVIPVRLLLQQLKSMIICVYFSRVSARHIAQKPENLCSATVQPARQPFVKNILKVNGLSCLHLYFYRGRAKFCCWIIPSTCQM